MPFSDISSRVTVFGISATDNRANRTVVSALKDIYERSSAGLAIDNWLNAVPGRVLEIRYGENDAGAYRNQGIIEIDPNFAEIYITKLGRAIRVSFKAVLTHELGHAVLGTADNDSVANLDGDNITAINPWLRQLGLPQQASYNSGFPPGIGPMIQSKDYTDRRAIVNSIVYRAGGYDRSAKGGLKINDINNFDLTASGVTGSTLIIGGDPNSSYKGTASNDWLYGGGGY
jgi:hypothetical protein